MTELQRDAILRLRRDGVGYTEIAKRLGLSVNTVKSFGRRCEATSTELRCLHCGQPYEQTPGKRAKRFCSDKCRLDWWHQHSALLKSAQKKVCPGCGIEFIASPRQKHCSHACYIAVRFGNGQHQLKVTPPRPIRVVSASPFVQSDAMRPVVLSTKTS